jgi:hypothetical protein
VDPWPVGGLGIIYLIIKIKFMNKLILFLLQFMFGVRIEGEPINLEYGVEQPKRTCAPSDQPDQFSWMRKLRVSSLHGVRQNVYLEG